jgi:hypothetical protein
MYPYGSRGSGVLVMSSRVLSPDADVEVIDSNPFSMWFRRALGFYPKRPVMHCKGHLLLECLLYHANRQDDR